MGNRYLGWLGCLILVAGGNVLAAAPAGNQQETALPDSITAQSDSITEPTDSVAMERMLEELVVDGYLSAERNAKGEVFRLSRRAKESGNPYIALSEIPALNVNLASRSVTTRDGKSPLILIDGRLMNSGIDPIDPKVIESVEVIEVPNARFLRMGYDKVLNIRLIKNRPTYFYTELRTRHEVIPHAGFAGGRFEVGKSTFAVSGNLFGSYLAHERTDYSLTQLMGSQERYQDGKKFARHLQWEGEVMFKWLPTSADYLSLVVKGTQQFGRGYGDSKGYLKATDTDAAGRELTTDDRSLNDLGGTIAGIYYDHTFSDESLLSVFGYYNYASGNDWSSSEERLGESATLYEAGEKSIRNQYHLAIDYDTGEKPYGDIAVGYIMEQTHNKSFNSADWSQASLSINTFDNYLHATYTGSFNTLSYMASAGLEYMDVRAAGTGNSSWRPRAAASVNWNAPRGNSLRLDYTLTNEMPATEYLATFNTSINPWYRTEGNPKLTPYMKQSLELTYQKTLFGRLWLDATARYYVNTDLVAPSLRQDGDVVVGSWQNIGKWQSPSFSVGAAWNSYPVLWSVNAYQIWESFDSGHYRSRVALSGNATAFFRKFIIQARCTWGNRTYTATGYSRYMNPFTATIILVYRPTRQIEIMAGMDYFCGVRRMETINSTEGYTSRNYQRFTGESLKPFILFSWTLRKNSDQQIDRRMPSL